MRQGRGVIDWYEPWLLDGASATASWAGVLIGLAVAALSLPRGTLGKEHYGGGTVSLCNKD